MLKVIKTLFFRIYSQSKFLINAPERKRRQLSHVWLSGNGLEIGALHNPLMTCKNVKVTYIDRMTVDELREQYPELSNRQLSPVDIVENGELLTSVKSKSQDFVIANQIVEHTENPLLAIENWVRVLKKGGVLYLSVPNKEKTFDIDRPITSTSHILRDYEEGPASSKRQHFKEWVSLVIKETSENTNIEVDRLIAMNYSIHYHVWDPSAFLDFINFCIIERSYPICIETSVIIGAEIIVILKKTS